LSMGPSSSQTSPYAPAAKILNQIWSQRKGLKSVVYSSKGELQCSRSTFAQCSHVLEHKDTLDKLMEEISSIQAKNEGLLYVLLYELVLGPNRSIKGGGSLKRQLMVHHEKLRKKLKQIQKLEDEASLKSRGETKLIPSTTIPRYVRINTLVADRESVLQELQATIKPIFVDEHVPDLFVVEPTPENRGLLQDLLMSNKIILQDKSSCFSALCLMCGFDTEIVSVSDEECVYLDACAAPGNKTSHLAALVHEKNSSGKRGAGNFSVVHALDKSADRYKLLKRRMGELVPQEIVKCHNLDFLETTGTETSKKSKQADTKRSKNNIDNTTFQKVRAILLDPSCSGSGMTTNHTEKSVSRDPFFCDDRIKSLSDFQYKALLHATTNFPSVNRVVYSTCSLYFQENEGVVKRVLEATGGEWKLVAPKCLDSWQRRGLVMEDEDESGEEGANIDPMPSPHNGLTPDQAKCCIRVDPNHDATNGFFVACLERKNDNVKKRKAHSTWKAPIANLPGGLELYRNEFDHSHKEGNAANEEGNVATKGPVISVKDEETNAPKRGKRKAEAIVSSEKSSNSGLSSKKRAKKLEWKRQQRLKKEERLKRKQAKET